MWDMPCKHAYTTNRLPHTELERALGAEDPNVVVG